MENDLIKKIEHTAKLRGMTESTLCRLAVNDGKLIARLRAGKSITLATASKLDRFLSNSKNEVSNV